MSNRYLRSSTIGAAIPIAVRAAADGSRAESAGSTLLVEFSVMPETEDAYAGRPRRVRRRKTSLVRIPSNQPSTAAARMIQTSDAWPVPTTQLSFTCRVFATTSAIRTTSRAMKPTAHV